jgi:YD repeat-containing protein
MTSSYTYDATGNQIYFTNALGRVTTNVYDGLNRLVQVGYAFDAVGNRTSRASTVSVIGGQSPTYTTNDWLTSDSYDSDGNTTTSSSVPYLYDYTDRLTNAGSGSVSIVYDADGNRSRKVTSATTLYLVATVNPTGYPQMIEEKSISGTSTNLAKVYTYGLSLISQRVPGGTPSTNFFGLDGHGSTRFLTDAAGSVANVFVYDAYGILIASNSAPQTAYLYCGEQYDSDLGLPYA